MKFLGFLVLALAFLCTVKADYIIDSFGTTGNASADRLNLQPSRYYSGAITPNLTSYVQYEFNNISNATNKIFPNLYLAQNFFPTGYVFGGVRRVVIASLTDTFNYAPQSGVSTFVAGNLFSSSIGSDMIAAVYLDYFGNANPSLANCSYPNAIQCSQVQDTGPLLSTPIDITENGLDQAIAFTAVNIDQANTGFVFTIYSSPTNYSNRAISVSPAKRSEDGVDDDITWFDVPLANPIKLANGKRATVGRRYLLPFTSFRRAAAAVGAADFTRVTGIQFQVQAILALDVIVQDFRTVPLVSPTKQATIAESVAVDNVAEPGEIINYNITLTVAQGLADASVTNVFFYDNPNKYFGYGNFLPNSVALSSYQYSQVNCSVNNTATCRDQYTLDPTNFGAVIFNASTDAYFANRIAIFFPSITSGSYAIVTFSVQIPNLPCVMQQCSTGCSFSTQASITGGQCYCQQNQGRLCLATVRNNTAQIARDIDASNNTNGPVDNCSPTTDVTSGTYLTVTPIGTTPNPALTIVANPTQKANGVLPGGNLTYTITLTNNRTRSSDSFVVRLTPDSNAICSVGAGTANPNFTSDATTGNPVYSVAGGLQYGQTLVFSITCIANPAIACGVNQTNMAATINFGTNTVNCPELTAADNSGSDFIPLIGSPTISLSKANAATITYGANTTNSVASFAISYANNGQRAGANVVITETIPAALAQYYQATDNPSFAPSGGNNYTLTITSLAAGQSAVVNFLLRVPPTIADCTTGSFINTVSSNSVCNGAATTAQATVSVNAVPDLAVTISSPSTSVQPGQQVCYNVQYQNIGYRVGQQVVLSINLPAFTNYSATGSAAWVQVGSSSVYQLTVGDVQGQSTVSSAQFCVVANANTVCGSFFSTNVTIATTCSGFPEQNLANNFAASSTTSIAGTVSLTLSKVPTVNGARITSANTGATIVYSISGSNTGTSQAQNVNIVETLPAGVTAGANSGFVLGSAGTYTYSVGNVNAGSSFGPFNFSVVVPSSVACPAPSIVNSATVTETCTGATASASATVTINAQPVLTLQAQNTTTVTLTQGTQTCAYACYGNTGTQTANSAVLTLSYNTAYLTVVSGANNGWTASSSGVLSFQAGNINVGSNVCSPAACFNVQSPIPCGVNNVNYTFTLTSPCYTAGSVVSATTTNIVANPVFTITKSNNANGDASPGQSVVYTITYQNTGLRIADNTVITESVPALLAPGSNPGWTCSAASCTYNVGSLSPTQGAQTITFTGSLTSNVPGRSSVNNTVVIASQPCAATATASSVLNVAGYPNLVITKRDTGVDITPGDYIYYTITYSNNGDTAAPNTVITDIVPAFTVFNRTLSTAGWSCQDGAGAGTSCQVNVGTVNPGQSGTVTFIVKSDDWIRCGTDFTQNYAYIATTVQESNYNDNNASAITPLVGTPDLVIMKTTNRTMSRADRAGPNDLLTYNITYENIGVRDATNAVIYETVPEYTTYVAAASSAWSCADGAPAGTVCTYALNSTFYPMMPGMGSMGMMGMAELVFSVRVISALPPTAHITTNCASINNTCGECNPYDNMACYTVNLFGIPDLTINQTATCRAFHWYVEWQNVGDQAAGNVVVTDTVPAGTNFVSGESDTRWSCNNVSTSANFGQCTLNVGEVPSGSGGSAVFVTSPQAGTTMTMFSNTASVTGTGRNPDPTPQNNQDTATVGFEGCPDSCDSCCPVASECCPDKTDVKFTFAGLLQGIDSCTGGSSSSS